MLTTIQVKKRTLERLKFFKDYSKESYDEIINKMLDKNEESQLTDQTINDLKLALKEVKEGKGDSIEDVAKEFGVTL